jgi:Trk K+ transport system NAD-binding subunit
MDDVAAAGIIPGIIIVGGDALALSTARELSLAPGHRVTVLWPADPEFAREVETAGATVVAARPESQDGLVRAGVREATAILALSGDDQLNLQAALRARDANPRIRIVLRQFNHALATKIEQNLPDCSVLSLARHSAATYAAAALDPTCFRGLQFPERDGKLTGFAVRLADRHNIAGHSVAGAERALGLRILAVGDECDCDPDRIIAPGTRLIVFGALDALIASASHKPEFARRLFPSDQVRGALRHGHWRLRRVDPYIAGLAVATVALFFGATWHFRDSFQTGWLTAAYFVMSTLTTTGYGDITPHRDDLLDVLTSIALMLSGTVITGIFIAIAAARLTRAQWVRMQGLRPIQRHGHIVLCGCGGIGSEVIDFLLGFGRPVVVIDPNPDPALVEQARDRGFELLTGDASRDDTLDLCNLDAAHSLVALTNIDTLNLEIALGARARNPSMPIVLRIAEADFAASIARHFEFETTFSVAALAGPVFAGLSRDPRARGRVAFGGREFGIVEALVEGHLGEDGSGALPPGAIPVAVANAAGVITVGRDLTASRPGTRILALVPMLAARDDGFAARGKAGRLNAVR